MLTFSYRLPNILFIMMNEISHDNFQVENQNQVSISCSRQRHLRFTISREPQQLIREAFPIRMTKVKSTSCLGGKKRVKNDHVR